MQSGIYVVRFGPPINHDETVKHRYGGERSYADRLEELRNESGRVPFASDIIGTSAFGPGGPMAARAVCTSVCSRGGGCC